MKYKIGEIAKLFGLSTESIRHYERLGLIHPQKTEDSSYRLYNSWDVALLSACRQYRAFDFSLEESAKLLATPDASDVLAALHKHERDIEQEIARQCQMLSTIRAWRREAEATRDLVGRIEIERNVPTMFLPYQFGDQLTRDHHYLSRVQEWLGYIPYVYVGMLIPRPYDDQPLSSCTIGLCMAEAAVSYLHPQPHDAILRIGAQPCLHTAFQLDVHVFDTRTVFEPLLNFACQQGLVPSGDLLCRFNVICWNGSSVNGLLDCFMPIE